MTDIDARLREAYDTERLPDEVRRRALAAIDEAREREGAREATFVAPSDGASLSGAAAPSAATTSGHVLRSRRRRSWRWALPAAACLVVLLALVGVFGFYQTPAAHVAISVNPSLELTVNPWGTVIAARGLNADGEAVVAEVPLDRLSYEEAIDRLVTSDAFAPYLTADALVDVAIESDDLSLGDAIAEQTDRVLGQMPCEHRCHRADGTTCGGGHGAGMGQGRGQGHGQGHGHHGERHGAAGEAA